MPSAKMIVDELRKWNVTHVIGIPDNGSAEIYKQLHADAEIEVITVSREGEAICNCIRAVCWGKASGRPDSKYRVSGIGGCHPRNSHQYEDSVGYSDRLSRV